MSETVRDNRTGIKAAATILKRGGTVVFPTETLYALGAAATNGGAVRKIYRIKRRQKDRLLPVIVGSIGQARHYFVLKGDNAKLARAFWPGALSLILRTKSKRLSTSLGNDYVAVRLSANQTAKELAGACRAPIVSTSANLSGKPGCFTVAAVIRQLAKSDHLPDLYIDGGTLRKSPPSTIICAGAKGVSLIREGKVPLQRITRLLGTS